MFRFLLVLLLFIVISCSNSYMVLTGKDGKKAMYRKQTPEFNKRYMEKQKRNSSNVKQVNSVVPVDNKDVIDGGKTKFVQDSSAYTSDSVLDDNTIVEEVVKKNNKITKSIIEESKPKSKTIEDFEYLPDVVFSDDLNRNSRKNKSDNESLGDNTKTYHDSSVVGNSNDDGLKIEEIAVASSGDVLVDDGFGSYQDTNHEFKSNEVDGSFDGKNTPEVLKKDIEVANTNSDSTAENIEVVEVSKKRSWWKFWDRKKEVSDKTQNEGDNLKSEDSGVISGFSTDANIDTTDVDDAKIENTLLSEKEINSNSRLSESDNNYYNNGMLEVTEVGHENNIEEIDIVSDDADNNIEVVNVSKKRSWWKFWDRKKEPEEEALDDVQILQYDEENNVPREDIAEENSDRDTMAVSDLGVDIDGSHTTKDLSNSVRTKNVLDAKKIDAKKYEEEAERNSNALNGGSKLVRNKFYVQIISLRNETKCKNFVDEYSRGNSIVYPVNLGGIVYYRGVIGPFNTWSEANREKDRIINMGHYDVFIFRKK